MNYGRMSGRAIVVGSGPNGLTAACVLAAHGLDVTVYEKAATPGGAMRSASIFGESTVVDMGAAAHPFGVISPAFRELRLDQHGLEWLHPSYSLAHPFESAPAALLHRGLDATASELGADERAWRRLHKPIVDNPLALAENFLGPLLRWPRHPWAMAQLGPRAVWPSAGLARVLFRDGRTRALFAGSSLHSVLPLDKPLTAAFGAVFGGLGMSSGWPVAKGGTESISRALVSVLYELGGRIELNSDVRDLRDLPKARVVLLDLTPRQVLRLAGAEFSRSYRRSLSRWKYGTAVSKVDYLLDGAVPWTDPRVAEAGTVHVGGTMDELQLAEREAYGGTVPENPFVMVGQQSAVDPSRAAEGQNILWTYAHVPHGCDAQVSHLVEAQIERFAPGFRDRIVERFETRPSALEAWNPNLVGGDIGGGSLGGFQQILRPAPKFKPYNTGVQGVYLCSSSTPPGGGVHGMAGWNAALQVLRDCQ